MYQIPSPYHVWHNFYMYPWYLPISKDSAILLLTEWEVSAGIIYSCTDAPTQLISALLPCLWILTISLKKYPAQQNSLAESSCELGSILLIHGDLIHLWVSQLKCLCIEIFVHFFIGWYERPLKTEKKAFYRLLISVSVPEIWAFKVSEILRKNAKRKLSILCPFNKNSDVTSGISTYSIFKSNVVQALRVRIK